MNWAKLHSAELDFEVFWQNVLQNLARRDRSAPAFVAISDAHNLRFIANWRCPPAKWRLLLHHCCCLLQPLQRIGEEGLEMLTFNESLDVVWVEAQMVYALVSGSWVEEPKFDQWDRQVSVHKCCQMSWLLWWMMVLCKMIIITTDSYKDQRMQRLMLQYPQANNINPSCSSFTAALVTKQMAHVVAQKLLARLLTFTNIPLYVLKRPRILIWGGGIRVVSKKL